MAEEQLMSEVLMYSGKTLKKKGEKGGNEWKMWKLAFDVGRQYPWQCTAFDKLSDKGLQVSSLVEGEYYKIVYKITQFESKFGMVKSKQAVLIQASKKELATSGKSNPVKEEEEKSVDWESFAKEYNDGMGEKGNPMHMLGTYVANHYVEEFKEVIGQCRANFKKEGK